jgi:hypothetical protein
MARRLALSLGIKKVRTRGKAPSSTNYSMAEEFEGFGGEEI